MKHTRLLKLNSYLTVALMSAMLVLPAITLANPTVATATVSHGSASFSQPNASTLNITNSPGTIINWQQFNIGANEITRFIQQNSTSAVLNRITSQNPTQILGSLNSNGRVFLINSNGIVFGNNSVIDTAGFVASTLNISDNDFLNNRLHFEDLANNAELLNQGFIHTSNSGEVILVAPTIKNEGVIDVEQGKLILAAGQSVSINSLNYDNIEFEVQAPENSVINLGKMLSDGGSIGVFAGSITNSGTVSANAITVDNAGTIRFVAQADNIQQDATITARSETGKGGHIEILGERVGLFAETTVDASGATGGGEVLVGGDYQGSNPDIKNAKQTIVSSEARLRADATVEGDGGKVIVWSDDYTASHADISARGGVSGGNGGFVEVSGKHNLDFSGFIDVTATHGTAGTVLFDPMDITVEFGGDTFIPNPLSFTTNPGQIMMIDPGSITNISDTGATVILQADRDITINAPIITFEGGAGGDLYFQAGQSMFINADISTDNGLLSITVNDTDTNINTTNRGTGQAQLLMAAGTTLDAGTGNIEITMDTGVAGTSGDIVLNNLIADHIILRQHGLTDGSSILQNAGGSITASSLFIDHDGATNGQIGTVTTPLNVIADNIGAHIHAPTTFGIFINATANLATQVTVGNTCYGAGAAGCVTFGSHLIRGLETVEGGGDISLDVTGDLTIAEQIKIDDTLSTGNLGDIAIAATGTITSNTNIINNIAGGQVNFNSPNEIALAGGTYKGTFSTSGAGTPNVNGTVAFDAVTFNTILDVTGGTLDVISDSTFSNDVNLTAGTITGVGDITLNGAFNWIGGILSGSGAWITNAASTISTPAVHTLNRDWTNNNAISWDRGTLDGTGTLTNTAGASLAITGAFPTVLDGVTINNQGTTTYSGAGNFLLQNNAVFTNNGTFNYQSNGSITTDGSGLFDNFGTIRRSISTNNASILAAFNANTGTVIDGLTSALEFGAMNILGDISTLGFGGTLAGGTHTIANGSHLLSGTLNWESIGISTIQAGTSADTFTIANGATFNISGGFVKTLNNATIVNEGTTVFNDGGGWNIDNNAVFRNSGTGLFDYAATSADINTSTPGASSGVFDNFGTVNRTGTGAGYIYVPFNAQTGTVINGASEAMKFGAMNILGDISTQGSGATLTGGTHTFTNGSRLSSGILNWDSSTGLSTIQAVTSTDTFTIANGATFNISGGFVKTLDNATIVNEGTTAFNDGGGWNINNNAVFRNAGTGQFNFAATSAIINTTTPGASSGLFDNFGTVNRTAVGTGSIDVAFNAQTGTVINGGSEAMEFGAMNILGDITTQGLGATLAGGTHTIANGSRLISGILNWDNTSGGISTIQGTGTETFTILNGATFNIAGGLAKQLNNATIDNQGITNFVAGGDFEINDNGSFINNTTGVFDIAFNGDITTTSGVGSFVNQGVIKKSGGDGLSRILSGFTNTGGDIEIAGLNSFGLGGAALTLDTGSRLRGNGTFIGDVINSGGSVEPGIAAVAGILTIDGNYSGTSGDVTIKLESAFNDQLIITGTADFSNTTLVLIDNGATVSDATNIASVISSSGTPTNFASVTNPFAGFDAVSNINGNDIDVLFSIIVGDFIWTGLGDGTSWNDPNNWNVTSTPSLSNNVSIGAFNVAITTGGNANTISLNSAGSLTLSGGTFTLGSNSTLDGVFTLSGGTLDITGTTLTMNNTFNWTGGSTIEGGGSGTLVIAPAATLAISTNANHILSNIVVNNQGTTNYATGAGTFFYLNNAATFNNNGIFDFQTDGIVSSGTGTGVFNNNASGQILKTVGTGNAAFASGVTFTNSNGLFNASTGSIELQGTSTMNGVLSNTGSDLRFNSSNITFADGSSVNGNLALVGGTVNIAGTTTINNTLNWSGTSTIAGPGTLVMAPGSVLNLSANVNHILSNMTLNNQGTTNYATGAGTFFFLNNLATFNNNGTFDFQTDGIVSSGTGNGVFNNNASGQILKTAGAGNAAFASGVALTNSDGLFNASAGFIELQGTTTMNGILSNAGSDLRFNSSNLTFADGSNVSGNLALVGGTVNIAGTTTINNTLNWSGTSTIAGPGTLVMASGSVLNISANANHILSNVTLNNQGTTNYTTGAGTFLFLNDAATFNNNGIFDFQTDGIVSSGTGNGVFNNNASGQILKTAGAGNAAFSSGVAFTNNNGLFNASAGSIELQGPSTMNGVLSNTGSDLRFNSSNITFADGSSVNGNLALVGGTMNIAGTTTINNTLNWAGTSTIAGPGTLVLAPGSVLNLTGNVNHILSNVTLNNQGITNYATGAGSFFFLNTAATFNNNGTFDFQTDGVVSSGTADGVFNNNASGQILKTAGAGNAAFASGVALTNSDGLFNASAGSIELQGPSTMNGVLSNTGSDLRFNSSNITFADGSSVNGNLALVGGTMNIAGTTTINNTLNWAGTSTIAGPGTLVLAPGSVLNLTGNVNHILSNVTLNNQGITNYATGAGTFFFLDNVATFNNNGTFDFQTDGVVSSGTANGVFNNNSAARIIKSGGSGQASIANAVTYSHTGATIDIQSGSFAITGAPLILDNGSVLQGANGTSYTGAVDNNAGVVRPGGTGDTGIFTITGNYTQLADGKLDVELQGTAADGTGYDKLVVTGTAALAGDLTIREINGFSAGPLDSFTYLTTTGISGDFSGKRIFPVGYAIPQTIGNQQSISFNDGSTVYFDNFSGDGSWNNAGNWSSGLLPVTNLDIDLATLNTSNVTIASGSFTVSSITAPANLVHNGGSLIVTGDANIAGTYEQNGANSSTTFAGTASAGLFDNNSGTLIVNGEITGDVQNDGTLTGSGTIIGNVSNNGILNPGNSPGTMLIDGNLTLLGNSLLNLDVAGIQLAGTDYDLLDVTGQIIFAGALSVIVPAGAPTLKLQDNFSPVRYASSSGAFQSITATAGYAFRPIFGPNGLTLETTAIPGFTLPELTLLPRDPSTDLVNSLISWDVTDIFDDELSFRQSNEDEEARSDTLVCS